MQQADALPEMAQRAPLYNQAEQLLIDNVAVCPLLQYVNHYALRPWVKGDFVRGCARRLPQRRLGLGLYRQALADEMAGGRLGAR